MSSAQAATEADLLRVPRDGKKYELVDGQIVVSPAGGRHGKIGLRLGARLLAYATDNALGHAFDSSTGFRLPTGSTRSPDVSFVAKGRLPGEEAPEGFVELAPDLAVEILSPSDDPRQVLDKVGEYLKAGVRLVWLVDPRNRRAVAYRSLTDLSELSAADELDGEDVVPGFRCSLAELLA